jgi:hypothetical protein
MAFAIVVCDSGFPTGVEDDVYGVIFKVVGKSQSNPFHVGVIPTRFMTCMT